MSNLDHKEIQIRVITSGVDQINGLIVNGVVKEYSARRALRELRKRKDVDQERVNEFERALMDVGFVGPRGKPRTGDCRRYKVQDSQRGTFYVRLPVDCFGLKPGDEVEAEFFDGEARVKPLD